MSDAHPDATSIASARQATARAPHTRGPKRAALSLGMGRVTLATAVVAALVAPSVATDSSASPAVAADTPVAATPLVASTDGRFDAVERSSRSSRSSKRGSLPRDTQNLGDSAREQSTTDPRPAADSEPEVVGARFATTELNVRTKPDMDSKVVDTLDYGDKVTITDVTDDEWRQVLFDGETRWVKKEFLAKSKPDPRPAGPSNAPCASGSGVESGLADNTIAVHRAVCNAFPSVDTYGGRRGSGGNHGSGHALDIMVSGAAGDRIAAFVRAHARQLGVSEVIWSQHIWTVQRAGEGWRGMSDRGSATANHYDHVHVSTY